MKERRFLYDFPSVTEPEWAPRVERWYQLDALAYGLVESWWHWRDLGTPSLIVAASPGASNESDRRFLAAAPSAVRFVHTLPSVRVAPLCQVMQWTGPVVCIQDGDRTLATAVEEAALLVGPEYPRVWALGVWKDGGRYRVDCWDVCYSSDEEGNA